MENSLNKANGIRLIATGIGDFSAVIHTLKMAVIWLAAGSVAYQISLAWLPAVVVDNHYIPAGADSFYHARRILDLVVNGSYFQFDPKVHAPEGTLLSWPWAYDYLIAQVVLLIQAIFGVTDPMSILVYIPPAWVFVNIAILMGITSSLNLPLSLRLISAFCFALIPLTQGLHGAGRIDHHYMEHTMVLLCLFCGINWLRNNSPRNSFLFGVVLGMAPGINNGLFVLQIPLLISLVLLWKKNKVHDKHSATVLGITLIASTLLILLPSRAFHEGISSYYHLSWFQLYVACCSAFVVFYTANYRFSRKSLTILGASGFILACLIIPQILSGSEFLLANIQTYTDIPETVSILRQIRLYGLSSVTQSYTALLFLAPFFLVYGAYRTIRDFQPVQVFTTVFFIFGFILLLLQLRMNYFGSFALYLPILMAFNDMTNRRVTKPLYLWAGLLPLVFLAYLPTLHYYSNRIPVGRSFDYAITYAIYPAMKSVCDDEPGVVLAEYGDGNFIRFHTNCSVIANNMVITPTDVKKVLFTQELLSMSSSQIVTEYPWINFVYVRRNDNFMIPAPDSEIIHKNKGLREELLLRNNNFPAHYTLIKELLFRMPNGSVIPYARLFKLNRDNK